MDFPGIDRFMKETGLDAEPAFVDLHFLTETIPSPEDRRILGLYFPEGEQEKEGFGYLPPSTIILPPDASEGTLLHELGHRYGHYYHGDLSEPFAENYRMAQEKRLSPIYAGSYARTEMPAPRASAVELAADWSVEGLVFRLPPASLKAGADIELAVDGVVNELRDSFPDFWQVAVVVSYANPDYTVARSDFQVFQSGAWGDPVSYAPKINFTHTPYRFRLGAMPNRNIYAVAQLFANHDHQPAFTPFLYSQLAQNGWEYITTIVHQILLDTAPAGDGGTGGGGGMKLYQQATTDAAKTYQGKAQTAIFTFSTSMEQLDFLNDFFVNKFVGECVKAIQQNSPGDQLLFLQLYRDTSPTLRTNYELHLTATDITGQPLPWVIIIGVALALISYWLVIRPTLKQVSDLIWGPATDGGKRPSPLSNPLVIVAIAGTVLVGIALVKGTSVKGAMTGK
ncbi:MAG: hypothetical protein Q8O55_01415 [Dehalococcoidales bacterium]|nr:hypothetical protein [Dehalococcoidales bacterium]